MCISGALACVAVPIYTEDSQKRNFILTIWRDEIIPIFFKKYLLLRSKEILCISTASLFWPPISLKSTVSWTKCELVFLSVTLLLDRNFVLCFVVWLSTLGLCIQVWLDVTSRHIHKGLWACWNLWRPVHILDAYQLKEFYEIVKQF